MATFEISLVINRPVEEVFAFISNPENQPRWRAATLEITRISSEPLDVGSVVKGRFTFLGRPFDGNLEIIALAPCAFGEAASPYRALIPPEKLDVVAEIMFGDKSAVSQARVLRGHAAMASFKRGKGEVFNGGTTEWAHALAARDPYIERITRNVLRRFGAL